MFSCVRAVGKGGGLIPQPQLMMRVHRMRNKLQYLRIGNNTHSTNIIMVLVQAFSFEYNCVCVCKQLVFEIHSKNPARIIYSSGWHVRYNLKVSHGKVLVMTWKVHQKAFASHWKLFTLELHNPMPFMSICKWLYFQFEICIFFCSLFRVLSMEVQ